MNHTEVKTETKIRKVAAGVYQLFLPLPMRPSIVNVYLVRDDDEWALIDTGMHTEDSIATLKSALAEVGCQPASIRTLISTHHHADHFGTSQAYQELTGAEVYLNELELSRVERLQSTERLPEAFAFFQQHDIIHGKAHSAYEVASKVFDLNADLPIFHVFAATFETLAHLHLLMYDGKVRRVEDEPTIRFIA